MAEHLTLDQGVDGSNPSTSSTCDNCGLFKKNTDFAWRIKHVKRRTTCKDCIRVKYQTLKTCEGCGKPYYGEPEFRAMCRSCLTGLRIGGVKSGPDNPAWKGGHKYWQEGKLGRDKDGLSWKAQRRLAWLRDSLTCQLCGKFEDGWRPDVHHIIPYRLLPSHDLTNLICYCRSCHKKAEATIAELGMSVSYNKS